jgi:hypothetical protein
MIDLNLLKLCKITAIDCLKTKNMQPKGINIREIYDYLQKQQKWWNEMRKKLAFGVMLCFVIPLLFVSFGSAVTWHGNRVPERTIAVIVGDQQGNWISTPNTDFPKSFYPMEPLELGQDEGFRLRIDWTEFTGNQGWTNLIEISTSNHAEWDTRSFTIEGKSIYSNFEPITISIASLKAQGLVPQNATPTAVNGNKYVAIFPSDNYKIFEIQYEFDTDGRDGHELIIHQFNLINRKKFKEDLDNFYPRGKVPIPGEDELNLTPPFFDKTSPKKIEVSFSLSDALPEGYNAYISTEPVNKALEEALKDFENGLFAGKLEHLKFNASNLKVDKFEMITTSDKIKEYQDDDKENGKYLVVINRRDTANPGNYPVVGALLEIKGQKPALPCNQCETILQCIACFDQRFVQGVFED